MHHSQALVVARRLAPVAALLLLAATAPAQKIAAGTLCEVTGDGVNLRSDSRITATSLGKAHIGDQVTVLGGNMGWYRITPPESMDAWMSSKYVDGASGRVTGDSVNVRTSPAMNAGILGHLGRSDQVTIAGRQGDWVRIQAPSSLGVWIHGKFLTPASGGGRRSSPSPSSSDAGGIYASGDGPRTERVIGATAESPGILELVRRADLLYDAASARGQANVDFSAVKPLYQEAQAKAVSPGTRHHVDLRLTEIGLREEFAEQSVDNQKHMAGRVSELQAETQRMRQEYESRLAEISQELSRVGNQSAGGGSTPTSFTASGWSWPMGKIWRRPGTHRLVVGGKTIYYLNSPNVDLNDDRYWKKYMGVVGQVRLVEGWKYPVLDVESVHVLDKPSGQP